VTRKYPRASSVVKAALDREQNAVSAKAVLMEPLGSGFDAAICLDDDPFPDSAQTEKRVADWNTAPADRCSRFSGGPDFTADVASGTLAPCVDARSALIAVNLSSTAALRADREARDGSTAGDVAGSAASGRPTLLWTAPMQKRDCPLRPRRTISASGACLCRKAWRDPSLTTRYPDDQAVRC